MYNWYNWKIWKGPRSNTSLPRFRRIICLATTSTWRCHKYIPSDWGINYRLVMCETTRKKRECQVHMGLAGKRTTWSLKRYIIYISINIQMSMIYTCYILYCTYVLFEDVDFFLLSKLHQVVQVAKQHQVEVCLHFYMAWNLVTTTSCMLDLWKYFVFFFEKCFRLATLRII